MTIFLGCAKCRFIFTTEEVINYPFSIGRYCWQTPDKHPKLHKEQATAAKVMKFKFMIFGTP